jgi:hypothetical protein
MNTTSVPYMASFPGGPARLQRKGREWGFLSDEELTEFIATAVNTGTAAVSDAEVGGGLVLSGAATTDDSGINLQLDSSPVKLEAGDIVRMMAEFKLSNATESDIWVGISPIDTSVIAGVSDFVGFYKEDGSTTLKAIYQRDGGTAETITIKTLAADTYYTVSLESTLDSAGNGRTTFYVDGVCYGKIDHTTSHLGENFNTLTVAFQSGTATGTITSTVRRLGFDID